MRWNHHHYCYNTKEAVDRSIEKADEGHMGFLLTLSIAVKKLCGPYRKILDYLEYKEVDHPSVLKKYKNVFNRCRRIIKRYGKYHDLIDIDNLGTPSPIQHANKKRSRVKAEYDMSANIQTLFEELDHPGQYQNLKEKKAITTKPKYEPYTLQG